MKRYYVLFFLMVLTIPAMLGVTVWQSNECGLLRGEIKNLEKLQENALIENKTVANEIVELLSIERIETEARRMGMHKMNPEDVILVVMGGRENVRR